MTGRAGTVLADGAAAAFAIVAVAGILPDLPPGGTSWAPFLLGAAAVLGFAGGTLYTRRANDAGRSQRLRLASWTVVRFVLAFTFMRYGVAKIVGMQFYQRFYLLDSRVVDMKPMGLAWAFLGHSYGYQAVSGLAEMLGAVFLCFRRTTTLGACVLFGVMSNVVLMNFYYDISVKLFSSLYLAMIAYLIAVEAKRFWAFFITDGPMPPRAYLENARPRTPRTIVAHGAWLALVLGVPTVDIVHEAVGHRLFTHEPILGAWDIGVQEGLAKLADGEEPWTKVYFEKGDYGFVRVGSTKRVRFTFQLDEATRELRISFGGDGAPRVLVGAFDRSDRKAHYVGTRDGQPFTLDLTRDLPR